MRKALIVPLLLFAFASGKGFTPWQHRPLPPANERPAAESVSTWKNGAWVPEGISAYAYDAGGSLVHAETWNAAQDGMRYMGTWSWDFSYGADSLPSGIREQVRLDGGWKDTLRNALEVRREFRTEGGDKVELVSDWHQGQIVFGSKIQRSYDASGREIGRTESRYDAGTWTVFARTALAYDGAGRLLSQIVPDAYKQVYAYDAAGNLVSSERSDWQAGAWRIEDAETRGYDGAGRLASITVRRRIPEITGRLDSTEKYVHTYPEPTSHEVAGWGMGAGEWIRQSLYRESFDGRGNVVERIDYALSDTRSEESLKRVTGFDARDNATDQSEYAKEGGGWVLKAKWHTEFDAGNRPVAGYRDNYLEGTALSRQSFAYRFDARGNLLESTSGYSTPGRAIDDGERIVYFYAAPTALWTRPAKAQGALRAGMALRGNAVIILGPNPARSLLGRIAPPR
jgi:YD repeat-containing protein